MEVADSGVTAPAPKTAPKRQRVCEGIRKDSSGYEAYVSAGGKYGRQVGRRFSLRTPLRVIKRWRELTRAGLEAKHRPDKEAILIPILPQLNKALPKSPDGWCYVYFIQDADKVKIGRATNPEARLRNFQTSHHSRLRLICAFPGHAVIEAALHARFAHRRIDGEWFRLDADMQVMIESLNAGQNPIALIW